MMKRPLAILFQSTLPRGSDHFRQMFPCLHFQFQSTLPRGSDKTAAKWRADGKHFNPRSLAGATTAPAAPYFATEISIHAPSRERPQYLPKASLHFGISIHAPSRERPLIIACQLLSILFQSTLPRGSDLNCVYKSKHTLDISIHAPSRERPSISFTPFLLRDFNPRSLAGATIRQNGRWSESDISIHAPSRERP